MSENLKVIESLINDGVSGDVVTEFKESEKVYYEILGKYINHLDSLLQGGIIDNLSDEEVESLFESTVSDYWRDKSQDWDVEDKRHHLKECIHDVVIEEVPSGFYVEGNEIWQSSNCY